MSQIDFKIPSPKEIYNHLNEYVIGQDEAKKILSVAVYNHYKRLIINNHQKDDITIEKSNVMLLGGTGTGKSFLIKTIAKFIGVPCYIVDSTKLSATGYVGDDVENCLVGLLRESDFNVDLAQRGICVLDEADKLATKSENVSITRDVGGECVQQGLLKIIEGSIVSVPPQGGRKHPQQECIEIDTSNILFIALGAFSGLDRMIERKLNTSSVGYNTSLTKNNVVDNLFKYVETEDLRKFGMIPEFIGRFPIITYTETLKKEDLVKILIKPKNSLIKQYQKLLKFDNIELKFNNNALKIIADTAIKNKTGARGLRKIVEKILTEIMFEYGGSDKEKTITINEDFVNKILGINTEIAKQKKTA